MKQSKSCLLLLLSVALFLSFGSAFTAAETLNAREEITSICDMYAASGSPIDTAEKVVLFKSVEAIRGTAVPDVRVEGASDELNNAYMILASLALSKEPKNTDGSDPVAALGALQKDDGGFGDLPTTVSCAVALQCAQAYYGDDAHVYSAQGVCEYLFARQQEDGGFGDLYATAQSLGYLAYFKSEQRVSDSIQKALEFIRTEIGENGALADCDIRTLCAVINALYDVGEDANSGTWGYLPTRLAAYKNDDGSYRLTKSGEGKDENAMLAALSVYDAVLSTHSAYYRLMTHGSYSVNIWDNIKDYVFVYGGLAVLSLVFWGYILFGRKKAVDKPEGESYDEAN